jgi:hypothetical protein
LQEDAMTNRSRFTCVGVLLLASLVVAAAAAAGTVDRRTTFTFNAPVAVPGVTLPAGRYLFRVATYDTREVVQVVSGDEKTPYAMFFVMPAWRPVPATDPELTFIETAADMPHAIRTWWHPGQSNGYEFLYPREQARRLAVGSGTPVLVVEDVPAWTESEPLIAEIAPLTEPVAEQAFVAPEEAPVIEPVNEPAAPVEETLPTTASPTSVLLAVAIASIALAAAMQLTTRVRHN